MKGNLAFKCCIFSLRSGSADARGVAVGENTNMNKLYYPLWYRLDNKDRYLIWYSVEEVNEDLDGVVLDSNGKIRVFVSLDALAAYAQVENISLEVENIFPKQDELNLHNLDTVVKWLKAKHSKTEGLTSINPNEFLTVWNLFTDVSRSTGGNFDIDRDFTKMIYSKLFWGNNLPAVTPEGKCYIPVWSRNEKKIIREVMSQGLKMFRNSIKRQ